MRSEVQTRELQGPGWFMFFTEGVRIESTSIPGPAIAPTTGPRGDLKTYVDYKTDYSISGLLQVLLLARSSLETDFVPGITFERVSNLMPGFYGHGALEVRKNFERSGELAFLLDAGNVSDRTLVSDRTGAPSLRLRTEVTIETPGINDRLVTPAVALRSEPVVEIELYVEPLITNLYERQTLPLVVLGGEASYEFDQTPVIAREAITEGQLQLTGIGGIDVSLESARLYSHYAMLHSIVTLDADIEVLQTSRVIQNEDDVILALFAQMMSED